MVREEIKNCSRRILIFYANNLEKVREQFLISSRTIFCVSYRIRSPPCYHVCIVVTRRRIKSNRRKRELLAAIPNLLAAHRAISNAILD